MSASSSCTVNTNYTNQLTTGTGGLLTDAYSDSVTFNFQTGTAANQIDLPWSHKATITGTTDTFTLSALTGPGSATTVIARARKIWVHNKATVDGNVLTLAPGGTHPMTTAFAAAVVIPAGGCALFIAPLATGFVAGVGASDQIAVTATGTVPYEIEIDGASV